MLINEIAAQKMTTGGVRVDNKAINQILDAKKSIHEVCSASAISPVARIKMIWQTNTSVRKRERELTIKSVATALMVSLTSGSNSDCQWWSKGIKW